MGPVQTFQSPPFRRLILYFTPMSPSFSKTSASTMSSFALSYPQYRIPSSFPHSNPNSPKLHPADFVPRMNYRNRLAYSREIQPIYRQTTMWDRHLLSILAVLFRRVPGFLRVRVFEIFQTHFGDARTVRIECSELWRAEDGCGEG